MVILPKEVLYHEKQLIEENEENFQNADTEEAEE